MTNELTSSPVRRNGSIAFRISKRHIELVFCHCERLKGAWQSRYYNQIASATPRNDTYHSVS
jgi:hypothetical protein